MGIYTDSEVRLSEIEASHFVELAGGPVLTFQQVKGRHSNVMFAQDPTLRAMEQVGYLPCVIEPRPVVENSDTHTAVKLEPVKTDTGFVVKWEVREHDPEYVSARKVEKAKAEAGRSVIYNHVGGAVRISETGTNSIVAIMAAQSESSELVVINENDECVVMNVEDLSSAIKQYIAQRNDALLALD